MSRLAAILTLAAFFSSHPQEAQRLLSPDKGALAVITPAGPNKSECQVEIRSSAGKVLFHKDYASSDGSHGYGVAQAAWTPNSQFFVYTMEDSGGRDAWHSPTWFFSRKLNRMFSLDDLLNDNVSYPTFKMFEPDEVLVTLWTQGTLTKRKVALSTLLPGKAGTPPKSDSPGTSNQP